MSLLRIAHRPGLGLGAPKTRLRNVEDEPEAASQAWILGRYFWRRVPSGIWIQSPRRAFWRRVVA